MSGSAFRPGSLPFFAVLLIGATLLVLLVLIPNQNEVLERALKDRDIPRLTKLRDSVSEKARAENPELHELLNAWVELDRAMSAAGRHMFDAGQTSALAAPFLSLLDNKKYAASVQDGLAQVLAHSSSPEKIEALGAALPSGMSALQRTRFWQDVLSSAKSAGNPVAGASAAQALSDGSPAAVLEIAKLWQQGNRSDLGIAALRTWFEAHPGDLPADAAALANLYLHLLREENLNSEALDFLIARQATLERLLPGREFVNAVSRAALASGRSRDAVPILKAWEQGHPHDAETLLLLANLAMGVGDQKAAAEALGQYLRMQPDDASARLLYAQTLEWSGHPSEAFDAYYPLAADGSRPAVDRLIALAPGLFREAELGRVLPKFVPATGTSPELLLLAKIFVLEGNYAGARELFLRHLAAEPDDVAILKSLAEVDFEEQRFGEARELYARAHKLAPGDVELEHKLVRIDWLEGRYDQIVEKLAALANKTRNPDVIQEFYSAAESLGDIPALVEAMELKLEVEPNAPAETYRNLAFYNSLLGRSDAARAVIVRGLEKFPDSTYFREDLAYKLIAAGDPAAALKELEGRVTKVSSSDIKSAYAYLLLEAGRPKDALKFLQDTLTPAERKTPEMLELAGNLFEAESRFREAEAVYREAVQLVPGRVEFQLSLARALGAQRRDREMRAVLAGIDFDRHPGAARDAAQVYLDLEDYRQGAALLRRYLAGARGSEDSLAWRMLGDATLSTGDPERAKRAYRRALQLALKETRTP